MKNAEEKEMYHVTKDSIELSATRLRCRTNSGQISDQAGPQKIGGLFSIVEHTTPKVTAFKFPAII